jgi:membrane dipeptidase
VLEFEDHRRDPVAWSRVLGISREAVELYLASEVIDLHVDSFIWTRIFGYRLDRRHGRGLLGGRLYSQVDLPRIREANITGCVWSITTNPLRRAARRPAVLGRNLARLREVFARCRDDVMVCRNAADYRRAREQDKHAAFVGVQGGNALDGSLDRELLSWLIRVTLVHLSTSSLGETSAARGAVDGRLTARGVELVHALDEARVFVDLAHIHRRGFFDAVAAHDRSLPLIVSHTGIAGLTPHWRNVDDDQLRAIAATGGVVGVMYQSTFLGDPMFGGRAASVIAHLEHVIATVGEDHAALGSDWDGMVIPPRDLPTCLELPRLVEHMLARRWSDARIRKVLGGNFLRALTALRG